MDKREDRWFVRTQGHTLGPLTAAAIEYSLKSGEILPSDTICAPNDSNWQKLSEHPRFSVLSKALRQSTALAVPPPPSVLWKKKRAPYAPPEAPSRPIPDPSEEETRPLDVPQAAPNRAEPQKAAEPLKAAEPKKAAESPKAAEAKPFSPAELPRVTLPVPASPKIRHLPEDSFPDPRRVATSLKAALKEWAMEEEWLERERQRERERNRKPPFELPPLREPVFAPPLYTEQPKQPSPAPAPAAKVAAAKPGERVIRIELKFPEWSRAGWARALAWLMALGMAALAGYFAYQNKTRDLKDFRLPDPSSPTTEPSPVSDPIPPLKAPTRPQRD